MKNYWTRNTKAAEWSILRVYPRHICARRSLRRYGCDADYPGDAVVAVGVPLLRRALVEWRGGGALAPPVTRHPAVTGWRVGCSCVTRFAGSSLVGRSRFISCLPTSHFPSPRWLLPLSCALYLSTRTFASSNATGLGQNNDAGGGVGRQEEVEEPEMDLDDYEALLLQTDEAGNGRTEDGGSSAEKHPSSSFSDESHPMGVDGEAETCGSTGGGTAAVHVMVAELIETVRDVLPADGSAMRLTDLTPSIDMEVLEQLPPPPGASCLSFLQFLQMHPKHFHMKQQDEPVRMAGGRSGVVQRWFVRRADVVMAPPAAAGSSPATGSLESKKGASLGATTTASDVDQLDFTSLFMEEEMRSVLEANRAANDTKSKNKNKHSTSSCAETSGDAEAGRNSETSPLPEMLSPTAMDTGAPGIPSSPRRRRLRPVSPSSLPSLLGCEGHDTSSIEPPHHVITKEHEQVWERVAGVIPPNERLTALQLRARLMEHDAEVLEWLTEQRGGNASLAGGATTSTDTGTASTGGVGFRRLMWEHAAVAKRFLDYDAASPEGWVSRIGVLQQQFPHRPVWEKPGSAVASSSQLARDESFAAEWDVELNLDEEDPLVEVDDNDGDEEESDAAGAAQTTGGTAPATGSSTPPPLSKKERKRLERERKEKEASLSRTVITSPDELLAEHTRLAEARGWRSPQEILDLLVECVPTFPVPVDQLVLSDVLIKLFGFKVSMKRLVLIYSYYVMYDKHTLPSPTVSLHPERVVGKHPHAGVANQYYKRWENAVYERDDVAPTSVASANPATDTPAPSSSSTPSAGSQATVPRRSVSSGSAGAFAPLRRTIKSRVTLRPKGLAVPSTTTGMGMTSSLEKVPPHSAPQDEKHAASTWTVKGKTTTATPSWGRRPLSDSAVAMHDLLQATTPVSNLRMKGAVASASDESATITQGQVSTSDACLTSLGRSTLRPGESRHSSSLKGGNANLMLEAMHHIYDPAVRGSSTVLSSASTSSVPSSLLLLIKLVLVVPYNQFITIEEAARRCGCDSTDALEDLLDRSQPTQSRYAAFLVHTSAAASSGGGPASAGGNSAAVVPPRRRRLIRLRPWWISPNSTGDLAATGAGTVAASPTTLPASFLKKLMPTWRPVHRLLATMPEEDRKALLSAAAYATSFGQYLQLFGKSSCWVEEHIGGMDGSGVGTSKKNDESSKTGGKPDPAAVEVDPRLRVRRYTGDLEMDDVEPLCLRALYYSCSAKEFQPLETLLEAAKVAENEVRQKLGLNQIVASNSNLPTTGLGLGGILNESKVEMQDFEKHLSRHQTLFEVKKKADKAPKDNQEPPATVSTSALYIKRRSLFTVQLNAQK